MVHPLVMRRETLVAAHGGPVELSTQTHPQNFHMHTYCSNAALSECHLNGNPKHGVPHISPSGQRKD